MRNIKILFAGDFCPINRVERLASEGKAEAAFGDVLTALRNKDLSVVNLECPLTKSNSPIYKSGPNLKADPKAVECIKAGGFDIVNLANNHIADYGSLAVNETIFLLQSNKIKHVGAGSSISRASKPLRVQCKGKVIVFLAFAEHEFNWADEKNAGAWPLDPIINVSQIREAKTDSDFVAVLVHGGNEYNPVPSPRIVKTYRAFVDAGATVVVGTHPHVPQGYEVYRGAPIFYSLGNFVFDSEQKHTREQLWAKSYMVQLNFQENSVKDIEIIPYRALAETGCLTLLKDKELGEFVTYVDFLSRILKDDGEIKKYWYAWCALMGPKWLRWLSLCSPIALTHTVLHWKHFGAMKCFLAARNLITCEAHNDILNTYMDLVVKNQLETSKEHIPVIKMLQKGKMPI
jgi:poly-gamma-glutamate synthesis protein (capsule biosynthesis protein)